MSERRLVAVCVDVPRLEVDRAFTYALPDGVEAGTGFLVSVPFHGRTVKGWVLGPTHEVPARVLSVRRVLSPVPLFDERALQLYRWMSDRYVAPLATVIGRAGPPRVASEEGLPVRAPAPPPVVRHPGVLSAYGDGPRLLEACRSGRGTFLFRPLPDDEAEACVEAVAACIDGGRDAVVVVPEAEPLPATARAVAEAFGPAALVFVGGERRERYRAWLETAAGRYRVVIGTRPAVFAPVPRLGLVWVNREAHPAHREERTPRHHTRDVATARGDLERAVCVLAAHSPSAEAAVLIDTGGATLVRASRAREREAGPLVETVRGAAEERTPRLLSALRGASSAFLLLSRRGYGVARACRSCGEPVRCGACAGPVRVRRGTAACAICETPAACPACGGTRFGVDPGGTEHVQAWAAAATPLPVRRIEEGKEAAPPAPGSVVVGTAAAVKDFGPLRVDVVAVLDADRARRRAGLAGAEQALATWMEAAAWAGPRGGGGRVLVQAREPGDPVVQALVRWDPWHFHRAERTRREEAGFPPGFPVFRVLGGAGVPEALAGIPPFHLLSSAIGEETVCLVTLRPDQVSGFRALAVSLAERGTVHRVEAEPQL